MMQRLLTIRTAALCVAMGSAAAAVATLLWSPFAFVVYAGIGVGAITLGAGIFTLVVLRDLKKRGAL